MRNNRWTFFVKLSVIARVLIGPFIFLSPVWVSVVSTILDGFDGELYKRAGYARPQYSLYDKILDYYWYVCIILYIVLGPMIPYRNLFVFLFIYRSIGQLLFVLSHNGIFLFLFPNIFETFFFYYLITLMFPHLSPLLLYSQLFYVFFTLIVIFSVLREIIVHLKKLNFSGLYLGKTTFWPVKTSNAYKVMILFSFFVLFTISLSINQMKNNNTIQSKADEEVIDGYIKDYDQKGVLLGSIGNEVIGIKSITYENIKVKNCQPENMKLLKAYINEYYTFAIRDDCLANLPDGEYILTLWVKNPQNIDKVTKEIRFYLKEYHIK